MKIFLAITLAFYFIILQGTALSNKNWTPEFKEFCKSYMKFVDKYQEKYNGTLSAGCCEINHPSNNELKKGYEGESLLFCNGKEII